jgi:uncharacterized protein (TIGR02186 family)
MRIVPIITFMIALTIGFSTQTKAGELVVDLSKTVVPITTSFTGTDLLLFGSFNNDNNADIVVVVRGPFQDEVVRRKERVMGVWANGVEMTFESVPSYYYIAANRPIEEFLSDKIAKIHKIGINGLDLSLKNQDQVPALIKAQVREFRAGLIATKQDEGLFGKKPGNVYFKGKSLFRTNLHFPANVPVGEYGVDVFVFRDNHIVDEHTTILAVQKFGIEASIYEFAHRNALLYGILAVILAAAAGWLASVIFRKS